MTRTFYNYFFSFVVLVTGVFLSLVFIASATSKDDIVYPVAELGGCTNETECRSYCDDAAHIDECLNFAEQHNLMSEADLQHARQFAGTGGGERPGGCTSPQECQQYCEDINNMDECVDFAEKHGFMEGEELEEARKVQRALRGGATLPGGCRSKQECEAYCEDPENMEQCITFAESAGFMKPDELQEAKKVLKAVRAGHRPPPCRGERECDEYCSAPENFEQCITFAEAADLIPPEELKQAKQALVAIRKGVRPPRCRGERECDEYCSQPEHAKECIDFAVAAGFMTEKDAELARKTGGRGPGGCRGEDECEAFCQNEANEEACFNFAKEHDLISPDQLREMEEGKNRLLEAVESSPPEVRDCFASQVGDGVIEAIRSGSRRPSRDMGEVIRRCFEELGPQLFGPQGGEGEHGEGGFGPPAGGGGPGFGDEHGSGPPGEGFGPRPEDVLQRVPPEARECVKNALGPDGNARGSGGIGDVVRRCVQESLGQGGVPNLDALRRSDDHDGPSPFNLGDKVEEHRDFPQGGDIQDEIRRRTEEETRRRIEEETRRREEEIRRQIEGQFQGIDPGALQEQFRSQIEGGFPSAFDRPPEVDSSLRGEIPPPPPPDGDTSHQEGNLLRIIKGILFVGSN